jgi:hypothetical protein
VKIKTLAKLGLAAGVALSAFSVAAADPVVRVGYDAPRLSTGKPDLQGVWTNATSTRLTRGRQYGERLILTPEEVAEIEGDTQQRNARQNAPTDSELQENWTQVGLQRDTLDECRSGSTGAACGYNAGWTDPGDWVMRVNGEGRTSLITYPADGQMPARATGSEQVSRTEIIESSEDGPATTRRNQNDNPETRSLGERCIMSFGVSSGPVMTPQLYNNTYKFIQTEDEIAIWVEMVHDVRVVRMNSEHRNDGIRPWMGDSIGWWDGDTLVVETINFHPDQNVRGAGPKLKVTERFTRVAPERLHYAFHVEDPETWVEPWGGEYEFAAVNGEIYEYACHEGNYGLEGILAGARYEDAESAGQDLSSAEVER